MILEIGWRGLITILVVTWLSFLSRISKLDSSAINHGPLHSVDGALSLLFHTKSQKSESLRVLGQLINNDLGLVA